MDQPVCVNTGRHYASGYVTLMTILILGVVGSTIAVSLLLLSTDNTRSASVLNQSTQARILADTCAELGLQQIRNVNAYTGSATTTFSTNSLCAYTVTSQGGSNRTIQGTGVSQNTTRRVQVIISRINPTFTITSWQEKPDFN